MPKVQLPQVYVVATAKETSCTDWFGDLLRICLRTVRDSKAVEIIDEERANAAGDIVGATFKISEVLSEAGLQRLSADLQHFVVGADVQLVRAIRSNETVLQPSEYSVEYFRREFAVDSPMVPQTDCCAMVRHLPSEKNARSTAHRSRDLNVEEALLLLEALVRNTTHVA